MNDLGDLFGGGGVETEGGGFADLFKQFSRGRGTAPSRPARSRQRFEARIDRPLQHGSARW